MSATIAINDRLLPGKTREEVVAGVTAAAAVDKNYKVAAPSQSTVIPDVASPPDVGRHHRRHRAACVPSSSS